MTDEGLQRTIDRWLGTKKQAHHSIDDADIMDYEEALRIILGDDVDVHVLRTKEPLNIANRYCDQRAQLWMERLLLEGDRSSTSSDIYHARSMQLHIDEQQLHRAIWAIISRFQPDLHPKIGSEPDIHLKYAPQRRHLLLILQWCYPNDFPTNTITKFSSSAISSLSSQPSFPFEKLPLELQTMVLEVVLRGVETVYYVNYASFTIANTNHANVLLASKRLYKLGRGIFLEQRTICLFPAAPFMLTTDRNNTWRLNNLISHPKLSHLSSVRDLRLSLFCLDQHGWKALRLLITTPKLNPRSITICDFEVFGGKAAVTKSQPDRDLLKFLTGRSGPRWFKEIIDAAKDFWEQYGIHVFINVEFEMTFRYERGSNRVFTTKEYGFNARTKQFYKDEIIREVVEKRGVRTVEGSSISPDSGAEKDKQEDKRRPWTIVDFHRCDTTLAAPSDGWHAPAQPFGLITGPYFQTL